MKTIIFILLQLAVYSPLQKQHTGFSYFENIVKNEKDIPLSVFKKFVRLNIPEVYNEQSHFSGKEVLYGANYTLFHIRQGTTTEGGSGRAHEIIVTFNKQHEQVDAKAFLYYCAPCPKTQVGYFSYQNGRRQYVDFMIEYYISPGREMPDPDRIKILKREKWHITDEGKIVLQ